MLDQVPLHGLGFGFGLADRLQERDSLQDERHSQHDVPHGEVAGRLRVDELLDAVRDRHRGAGHKQPERGEQRPHVRLPAMAERMRGVRRAAGPPVGDQQEDLVAGISPRMRRLSHQRRRPSHHGSDRLRHRDQHVGAESDQHRRETLRRARIAQQGHRPKQVKGPAGDTTSRRRRRCLVRRPARAPSTSTNTPPPPQTRADSPPGGPLGKPTPYALHSDRRWRRLVMINVSTKVLCQELGRRMLFRFRCLRAAGCPGRRDERLVDLAGEHTVSGSG